MHCYKGTKGAAHMRGELLLLGAAVLAGGFPGATSAQQRIVPDTYTAVTTNMTPAGVELRINVLHWSTDEERAAAIAAMAAEDPRAELTALPTAGVVWRSGSPVGHAIKYAQRREAADGGEIVTLVTDRPVGSSSFRPWVADAPADASLEYSVVELTVPLAGDGEGTMSIAADVLVDSVAGTVSLERSQRAPVLGEVVKQPKPYWATDD